MGKAADVLEQMRRNPAADWSMADIEKLCRNSGVLCRPPTGGGSHYKIAHPAILDILTIPARRPIKPKYIRLLVKFVDLVLESQTKV